MIYDFYEGFQVEVKYWYEYDAGVWTYSNGDPGYPPDESLEIVSIIDTATGKDIYDELEKTDISILEETILDHERDGTDY